MMALGEDGQLKRKAAGKRAEKNMAVVFRDEARTVGAFGVEDVTEKTALLDDEVFAGPGELAFDGSRNERKRDLLRSSRQRESLFWTVRPGRYQVEPQAHYEYRIPPRGRNRDDGAL